MTEDVFERTLAACRNAAEAGDLATAVSLAADAVEQRPRSFGALFVAAVTFQRAGRINEATTYYERAMAENANVPELYHNLGRALLALGRIDEAAVRLRRALTLRPDYAEALDALGYAVAEGGAPQEAVALFERSLAIDGRVAAVHARLGNLLLRLERYPEASARFTAGLERAPHSAELHDGRGVALEHAGRMDDAIAAYRRALACDPGYANAACNLGKILVDAGDLAEAAAWLDHAVELQPRNGSYYLALMSGASRHVTPARLDAMRRLGDAIETLPGAQQGDLHFALGSLDERAGRFDQAFRHLRDGNAIRRAAIAYDESSALAYARSTIAAFGAPLMEQLRGCGDTSERPIFVAGMPRSGSTLVEALLAAHPAVAGTGENGILGPLVRDAWSKRPASPAALRAHVREIGERYLRAADALAPADARFVDKTLENVQLLPLLHCALPNARIVHIRRDPLDTCFSCFATPFAAGKVPFSYDLRELGRYYRSYLTAMDRWRAFIPPDRLLEVDYEQLVQNFEAEARRITAFCGLAWDPACLAFHQARRTVRTASNVQVRQPLYGSSVGRAAPFLAHLTPLIEALNA